MNCNVDLYWGVDLCLVRSSVKVTKNIDDVSVIQTLKLLEEEKKSVEEKKKKLESDKVGIENDKVRLENDKKEHERNMRIEVETPHINHEKKSDELKKEITKLNKEMGKHHPDKFAHPADKARHEGIMKELSAKKMDLENERKLYVLAIRCYEKYKNKEAIEDVDWHDYKYKEGKILMNDIRDYVNIIKKIRGEEERIEKKSREIRDKTEELKNKEDEINKRGKAINERENELTAKLRTLKPVNHKKMHTAYECNFGFDYRSGHGIFGGEILAGVNVGRYPRQYSTVYWSTIGRIGRQISNSFSGYIVTGIRMEPKGWMYVAGAGVRYKVEKNLFVRLEHNFCWRAKYRVQAIKLGVGWVI